MQPSPVPAFAERRCGEFRIRPVWRRLDDAQRQQVIDLWVRHRVLRARADPERRVRQVVCVAHEASGALRAVSTALPRPLFERTWLSLRLFVAPGPPAPALKFALALAAHECLRDFPWRRPPAGLAMILSHPRLRTDDIRDQILLQGYRLAGTTTQGAPIYLYDLP